MNYNYYEVCCKGGHVGRNFYVPVNLYVKANSGKEAAAIARFIPRIKHHHKDAILAVSKISYEEYIDGRKRNNDDCYFYSESIQEQRMYEEINLRMVSESKAEKDESIKDYKFETPMYKRKKHVKERLDEIDDCNQIREYKMIA